MAYEKHVLNDIIDKSELIGEEKDNGLGGLLNIENLAYRYREG